MKEGCKTSIVDIVGKLNYEELALIISALRDHSSLAIQE
jgi:hypothetical protein